MQSPKALEAGDANNVVAAGEGFTFPAYAMDPSASARTSWRSTTRPTRRSPSWPTTPTTASSRRRRLVFKIIPDESTRRQELQAGSIDGYDLPNPVDWKGLEDEGNKVEVRPAFNILYMGLNPKKNPKLKDLKVRQALYHALNRDQMVKTQLPEGAKVASAVHARHRVAATTPRCSRTPYDPEKAKALLKEAGAEGMTLQFAFPTEVTRPYMPDPQKIHDAFKKDLEAVGIKVEVVSKPWNGGYLDDVNAGKYDAWLLGLDR